MEKNTLGCYHDIYLKTDVLLLVDVFEAFRDTCLKNYKLDPALFYTAPGLAWQALLKTAAEYEYRILLYRLLMVEKGIRARITQAVKRYARANNKYMKDLYNPDEKSFIFNTWVQTTFTDWQLLKTYQHIDFYGKR